VQSLPQTIDLAELDDQELADLPHAYWDINMIERTEQVFNLLLEHNSHSRYAMSSLSNLYLTPPKREDKAREMVTRLLAEYPNNADSWYYDFMLKFSNKEERNKSLRKYLTLVNHNDPYEQARIKEAKGWLGEL
jgi:lipopolysaccharide biosynthesis regulator YciM